MALSSPGVEVKVIDESFYTPAEPGTVPMIFVASAQDKTNASGTGIAQGTLAANAGKPYLVTSQRELADLFGDPTFYTDNNNNPIHGGELNEYGLQAAYSLLGVSNRAYVVRAGIDLGALQASADAPEGNPADGYGWFDLGDTSFGIFEWDGTKFVSKTPILITDDSQVADAGQGQFPRYIPNDAGVGANGDYAVVAKSNTNHIWYKAGGVWYRVGTAQWSTNAWSSAELYMSPHTDVPQWKTNGAPAGSVWIKTTSPNAGADLVLREWNDTTGLWEDVDAPLYANATSAIKALDSAGGGVNIPNGTYYAQYNITGAQDPLANFKIFERTGAGASSATSAVIDAQASGTQDFDVVYSKAGASVTVSITSLNLTGVAGDANDIANAINGAVSDGLVSASVDSQNRIVLSHTQGGEIDIVDTTGLFAAIALSTSVSNWSEWDTYAASVNAPTAKTVNGALWYNSIVDEVDLLVHNGTDWEGYKDVTGTDITVAASQPSGAVSGDIWIDTSDLENYPVIYKHDGTTFNLVDKGDQTSDEGILFADARWGNAIGADALDEASLSTGTYVDPDAPDPALYPQGMLLWNLRRSGFNVKKFVYNHVEDPNNDGVFYDRWVTESANNADGSGSFGRNSQRKVVIQGLQAMVNSNDEIRDDEARVFNLMACPGYPELIGEMISLNYDRGLSAFVVGDSPLRLKPDATSLNEWGQNVNLAVEDNDRGLVSRDEYLGVYYPAGFTSDNFGNNVIVPPSHMVLRTIALSDQVSYPWFAPAGTRRGGVTNATATGYIDAEGEFVTIALNEGQRDTLQANSVNPITFLNGVGLVTYGQKTRARNASALDRINVARLVIYLRSQLNKLAKPYIFEPNDKITRDQIKQAAESLMIELVGQRALYDFLVVCDESNNTPSRIDRNELYLDIAIEPVKAVEFIYIPLRLKNTGEIAGL